MKNISVTIEVEDDYIRGYCWNCPFAFTTTWEDLRGVYPKCILNYEWDKCEVRFTEDK